MPALQPLRLTREVLAPIEPRFWSKVDKRGPDECWTWLGAVNQSGYGTYNTRTVRVGALYAHRISYALVIGATPGDDLVLDHLCRNPLCVNPDHLEPVTPAENARRATRATCPQGHAYDEVIRRSNGLAQRSCRTCRQARARATRARNRVRRRAARSAAYTAARGCDHTAHRGTGQGVQGQVAYTAWEPCHVADSHEGDGRITPRRGYGDAPAKARETFAEARRLMAGQEAS